MQATLKKTVRLDGVGLHSGAPARLEMHPAPAGHGIVFRRVDLATARDIPARWDNVIPSKLCTKITRVFNLELLVTNLKTLWFYNVLYVCFYRPKYVLSFQPGHVLTQLKTTWFYSVFCMCGFTKLKET